MNGSRWTARAQSTHLNSDRRGLEAACVSPWNPPSSPFTLVSMPTQWWTPFRDRAISSLQDLSWKSTSRDSNGPSSDGACRSIGGPPFDLIFSDRDYVVHTSNSLVWIRVPVKIIIHVLSVLSALPNDLKQPVIQLDLLVWRLTGGWNTTEC